MRYLLFFILFAATLSLSAQTSVNEATGFWTLGTSWAGGVMPGTLAGGTISAVSKTIVISGTIKAVDNINLSGTLFNGASITVNSSDTLVLLGNLAMGSFSTLNNNGVLVVMGNFTNNGGTNNVNGTGKMVVTGNYSTSNFLGTGNTFTGPSYVYGSVSGLVFNAGDIDSHADLISNDPALNTWVTTMFNTLPVQLVYFKAKVEDDNVILSWRTASELNNSHFVVERSADGIEFKEIVTVNGAGNSSAELDYEYIDDASLAGVSYYRLTQVDYDGVSEAFTVVSVKQADVVIAVFPVPASDYLFFRHIKEDYIVIIDDLSGGKNSRHFKVQELMPGKLGLDIRDLEAGIYNVRLVSGSEEMNASLRFVKR